MKALFDLDYHICGQFGALIMNPIIIIIIDKYEMCCLLVDQFTGVFTTPDPNHIVTDPVSFFAHEHITDINQNMF